MQRCGPWDPAVGVQVLVGAIVISRRPDVEEFMLIAGANGPFRCTCRPRRSAAAFGQILCQLQRVRGWTWMGIQCVGLVCAFFQFMFNFTLLMSLHKEVTLTMTGKGYVSGDCCIPPCVLSFCLVCRLRWLAMSVGIPQYMRVPRF